MMVPMLEVEDVPGTTTWRVTLRGVGYAIGITRYFDGPNAKADADAFVMKALRVVQEADEAAKAMDIGRESLLT